MLKMELTIAGFSVRLELAEEFEGFLMPESWKPFLAKKGKGKRVEGKGLEAQPLFTMRVETRRPDEARVATAGMREVTSSFNDLGVARLFTDGRRYVVGVAPLPESGLSYMEMTEDFSSAIVRMRKDDPRFAFILDSMMRIWFSQAIVAHRAFLLHASVVTAAGKACLFMGKSGTGKSTHSRQWLSTFSDTSLLNDDNPVVRISDAGVVTIYGSPWSGKTPCYKNESAPAAGFVRLCQAPHNEYTPLEGVDAFIAILPGVSVINHSRRLYGAACATVIDAVGAVPVGSLACLPDSASALLCRQKLATPEG